MYHEKELETPGSPVHVFFSRIKDFETCQQFKSKDLKYE